MEIPQPIRKQVEKKGGIVQIASNVPNDERIMNESNVHKALSDPIRLKILNLITNQPLCVCLIKEVIGISDSKLSYHLSILKENGLIEGKQKGKWIIYNATKLGKKYAR